MSPYLWQQSNSHPAPLTLLTQNEDTFTQGVVRNIILSIVNDLEVVDHWSRDPLPRPHEFEELYFPDYFADFEGQPLFVVEIKKPGTKDPKDSILEGDQRKLPCMMKLVLDNLLATGVSVPSVIGLLIKGSRCEIFSLSLDYEALYIYNCIGAFELPTNNLQLGLLCSALGPVKFAHNLIKRTVDTIIADAGGLSQRSAWRRPSYYIRGNLVPPSITKSQNNVKQGQS
ncbi:hypothetical protein BGZ49_001672 [Haplosporangium sp. Z 27]|nr:hypothetical protein BGZ49_001672 [Haplosporangium sp. Z 27]